MTGWLNGRFEVVRAVGLAVWSWAVVAAMLALTAVRGQSSVVVINPQTSEAVAQQVRSDLGLPVSVVEVFANVFTLNVGRSYLRGGVSAWDVVADPTTTTLTLLVLAVVFAALLGLPLVALQRRTDSRLVGLTGYVGAVPAVGWLVVFVLLAMGGAQSLLGNPARSTSALVLPALALALPLVAMLVRLDARSTRPSGVGGDGRLEAWLWVNWLVGAVVAVERLYGIPGIGAVWLDSVQQGDFPVFFASTAVLTLPLVALSVVRELVGGREGETQDTHVSSSAGLEADGGANLSLLGGLVRTNRQVTLGLGGFVVLLCCGLAGTTLLSPPQQVLRGGFSAAYLAVDLGVVTLVSAVGGLVGGGVGCVLGTAASHSRRRGTLVRLLTDAALNVPLVVFVVVAGLWTGLLASPSLLVTEVAVGLFTGLALAALALRVTERELARRGSLDGVLLSVAGVVATGTALLTFVVAELALVGVFPSPVGQSLVFGRLLVGVTVGVVVVVTLPALSLLVVGNGLRKAVSAD